MICCMLSSHLDPVYLHHLPRHTAFWGNICSPHHLHLICTHVCPFWSEYLTSLLWKKCSFLLNFVNEGDTAIISEPAVNQVLYAHNHILSPPHPLKRHCYTQRIRAQFFMAAAILMAAKMLLSSSLFLLAWMCVLTLFLMNFRARLS